MYQNRQAQSAQHHPVPSQQRYTVQHNFDDPASLTATVTHALSDISGFNVTDIEFALKECVDTDALDRLFIPGSPRENAQLSFSMRGYHTTIYGNGSIFIVPPQQYQHPSQW